MTKSAAAEKVQENEFLMRCVMRVLVSLGDAIEPYFQFLLTSFVNITKVIRHNPSNPRFYYFLFEATGALIRFSEPSHQQELESTLWSPFSEILTNQVQEFVSLPLTMKGSRGGLAHHPSL